MAIGKIVMTDVQVLDFPLAAEDLETSMEIMVIVTLVIVVTSLVSISVTSAKARKIPVITMADSETTMEIMATVTLVIVVISLVSISVTSVNKTVE